MRKANPELYYSTLYGKGVCSSEAEHRSNWCRVCVVKIGLCFVYGYPALCARDGSALKLDQPGTRTASNWVALGNFFASRVCRILLPTQLPEMMPTSALTATAIGLQRLSLFRRFTRKNRMNGKRLPAPFKELARTVTTWIWRKCSSASSKISSSKDSFHADLRDVPNHMLVKALILKLGAGQGRYGILNTNGTS